MNTAPTPAGKRARDTPTAREGLRGRLDAGPHERLCELTPGDPNLEFLE